MAIAERLEEVRTGFNRTFWIANTIELFERLAFYGSKAILAVFLVDTLAFGPQLGGSLVSLFSGVLYFLPFVAGVFVDHYGFKRSLAACFAIFSIGYFLIGFGGMAAGQGVVEAVGKTPYIVGVLLLTAIGGSLIKPCIVGTVANTTTEKTKSLGYSIYYTLVNIGGAVGPTLALPVRENLGIQYVLVMSSITSAAMFIATLLFFKEPVVREAGVERRTLAKVFRDMFTVFANIRFMLLLTIFSGFYIMFWQIFYCLPFYVKEVLNFEKFELLETVDAWMIIVLTVPIAALVRSWRPIVALSVGLGIASVSWLVIAAKPSVATVIVGVAMFALGESILAPRFYEYVAGLAPKEQVGTYMGFAFVPIAIGSFGAGPLAGWLVATYIRTPGADSSMVWYWVAGIGVVSTTMMVLYDRLASPKS